MNEEEIINVNGIREDLYQAMQIGDITLNSKCSQQLVDFMNYQDKEIERLNNIINELKNENEKLYNICETNNIVYLQGLEDSEKIKDFKYGDFVKKWLKDTKEKLQRGDIYEQTNNSRKE